MIKEDIIALVNEYQNECKEGACGEYDYFYPEHLAEFLTKKKVEPVRHGYWTGTDYDKCSVCGGLELGRTKYCPHCGAKMDEVDNLSWNK